MQGLGPAPFGWAAAATLLGSRSDLYTGDPVYSQARGGGAFVMERIRAEIWEGEKWWRIAGATAALGWEIGRAHV